MRPASQLRSLYAVELGTPLPSRLSFRSELGSLTRLRFCQQSLKPSTFSSSRHNYITQLVPSPDNALLAVASTDGRLEIHEPADSETQRLTILPIPHLKLSAMAWGSIRGSDCVLLGHENTSLALYDLNTCQVDRPTRQFRHSGRMLSDVAMLDGHVFAAAIPNSTILFDARVRTRIAEVDTRYKDAVLAGEDVCLYVADAGTVVLWDRRKLTSCTRVGSMAKRADLALSRRAVGAGRFNSISMLPGAAPGSIFFHLGDGAVGQVDMAGDSLQCIPEKRLETGFGAGEQDLLAYGTTARSHEYPWYVKRRRAHVVRAPFGLGWRALVPNVTRPGFRVFGFGPDMPMLGFSRELRGHKIHLACVHALNGTLEQIVLGGARNDLHFLEVDRTASRERESVNDS